MESVSYKTMVNIPFDTEWMQKENSLLPRYSSLSLSLPCTSKMCGIDKEVNTNSMFVQYKDVTNIQELAKGFLLGALYREGLSVDDVIFFPVEHMESVNKLGMPVYIWATNEGFELETWFLDKSHYEKYDVGNEAPVKQYKTHTNVACITSK